MNPEDLDLDASEQDLPCGHGPWSAGPSGSIALRERYNAVPWTAELATLAGAEEMHARIRSTASGPR